MSRQRTTERVAMRHDHHILTAPQRGRDRALPNVGDTLPRLLERLGRRDRERIEVPLVGLYRLLEGVVSFDGRWRRVVGATPRHHLGQG